MSKSALRQISALPQMEYQELKKMWDGMFDHPPRSSRKEYMVRRLAYRIQELKEGSLSEETRDRLKALKRRNESFGKHSKYMPSPGTILEREYDGMMHRVTVLPEGFEYGNVIYSSLSKVARAITGTQWSGPKFFGLKK